MPLSTRWRIGFCFAQAGADISSSAYDFANRVTKTRRDHTGTPPGGSLKTYTIREEYVYDEASRLRFTRHKIYSNNWVVTSAPVYDELSRLQDKRLHASNYDGVSNISLGSNFNYLQSLDYSYNIRGWLTGINDPASCSLQGGDQLTDLFTMGLDYESTANGAAAQYNGNIAAMQWRTNVNGSCMIRQQYRFTYDYANRLLTANHFTHNGTAWVNTNNYSESNIAYDLNGNIKTYNRQGQTKLGTFGVIDQLTYTYGDAARPDRLTNVSDAGSATKGFKFTSGAAAYQYDLNGNLTQDNHKALTLSYNYLNLPNYITNPGGAEITVTYTADGEKLTKVSPTETRNYVSGIEYLGNALDAIYHGEGRCTPNGASAFYYEYTLKDHLGNARINFRANGTAVTFLQELHYYPFGMIMEGIGTAQVTNNGYKYNGKELNEDLGLNLSDYGARWYDAALGRWWSVDPMGDYSFYESPYAYGGVNPIKNIDIGGLLKFPAGSNYETKYSKTYNFLKGEGIRKLLSNPDIRNGLKVIGKWTDDQIESKIVKWSEEGIEIKFVSAPGGAENADGQNESSNQQGSAILVNEKLAQNVQNAVSLEEQQGALLALMATILHETVHWGRYNFDDFALTREAGNFSRKGSIIKYKGDRIINLSESDEIGSRFVREVWRNAANVSSCFDAAGLQSWINTVIMLNSSKEKDDENKVPDPDRA